MGFGPLDTGGLATARALEKMALLNMNFNMRYGCHGKPRGNPRSDNLTRFGTILAEGPEHRAPVRLAWAKDPSWCGCGGPRSKRTVDGGAVAGSHLQPPWRLRHKPRHDLRHD
jgi:hypothetical protein